jgi:hypothetical protein
LARALRAVRLGSATTRRVEVAACAAPTGFPPPALAVSVTGWSEVAVTATRPLRRRRWRLAPARVSFGAEVAAAAPVEPAEPLPEPEPPGPEPEPVAPPEPLELPLPPDWGCGCGCGCGLSGTAACSNAPTSLCATPSPSRAR